MAVTQLSVFLPNKPGTLADTLIMLSDGGINLRALSIADTKDFGILRTIVSDTEKAKAILRDHMIVSETAVIAVEMSDEAGALSRVLHALKGADVNIEYLYAFTGAKAESAYVVLRVDDPEAGEKVLSESGFSMLSDESLAAVF